MTLPPHRLTAYRLEILRIMAQMNQVVNTVAAQAPAGSMNDLSHPLTAWMHGYLIEMGRHASTTLRILNQPNAVAPDRRCIFRSIDNIPRRER